VVTVHTECTRVLVEKPGVKRQLGRHRRRWVDNVKKDLQEVGLGAWTTLIWLRKWTDKNDNESSGSIKCLLPTYSME
jgi:hypothetical protein